MLALDGVHAHYGKSHVLHGVSLRVERGEVVGLLGRNGVGQEHDAQGRDGPGAPVERAREPRGTGRHGASAAPARPAGIAWVPEDRRIFRLLTVFENLRTGLDRSRRVGGAAGRAPGEGLPSFPVLAERRRQAGGTLSGGEQQMLAIARAMMLEPKIILLDEPTEGLMPRMVGQIREIIRVLHREGVAILLVEQNLPLTLEVAERVYVMEKGAVRHHAPAADLRADPGVLHQYLGV